MFEWLRWKITGELTTKMKLDMANSTVAGQMSYITELRGEIERLRECNSESHRALVKSVELVSRLRRKLNSKQS